MNGEIQRKDSIQRKTVCKNTFQELDVTECLELKQLVHKIGGVQLARNFSERGILLSRGPRDNL